MTRKCKVCRAVFEPKRGFETWCCPDHGFALATAKLEKAKATKAVAERRETKAKLEKLKTRAEWARECQVVVNKVVRLRDMLAGRGCITCGAQPAQKVGGTMDAGQFRSVGSAPHLRLFTPQIALQCVTCNRYQGGRALDFRRALVERRGAAWVEALESRQEVARFDIPYLQRLKAVFARLARRLEKRLKDASGSNFC